MSNDTDRLLAELASAKPRWRQTSLARRIELAAACVEGVWRSAGAWVASACEAKGLAPDNPTASEDLATGPVAVTRYLQLLITSLRQLDETGKVALPGPVEEVGGRLRLPIFPARGLFDSLLFRGYRGWAMLPDDVTRDNLPEHIADHFRRSLNTEGIALVLGAGNVSSIPAADALSKLFQENRVVLLKLNPVNGYLAPVFEAAFAPLIEAGFLRLMQGGAEAGAYAVQHPQVDEVHITGSLAAHEAIVWGAPGEERDQRRQRNEPLLTKPITSELSNVTPWIVAPGEYTERQLDFQAENVAAMIVNNASFNCIAVKLIVTARGWPQRERFLDKIDSLLARQPRRLAYYPGARERYRRFVGREPDEVPAGTLPWTLVRGVEIEREPHWFAEESFVCACAETGLASDNASDFLNRAVEFVNERVWGTLGVGLMIPPGFRQSPRAYDQALARLRYGTVGVNVWPALAYAMMCVPWGGYPGGMLADPQSGIGWVHNTWFLDRVEKSVVEAPLVVRPKPFWFPTHRQAHVLARRVLDLYRRPAWWKLPGLVGPALRG
ncbi:MAG TPA: hypothetical protein VJ783_04965 [Pirellulales bacterium]|nr:hypothetical protein [Pirellulales bacterium]